MQIPAEKVTSEFTSWVSTQDEKTVIRFLLLYVGLSLKHQSHAEGRAPHALHLKKRQEVSSSSTQQQMGPGTHAVTKKAAATHILWGRKDWSPHLEVIKKTLRNSSMELSPQPVTAHLSSVQMCQLNQKSQGPASTGPDPAFTCKLQQTQNKNNNKQTTQKPQQTKQRVCIKFK